MQVCKELLGARLERLHDMWDEAEGLIGEYREDKGAGYHSNLIGMVHETNKSAEYATAVLYTGDKPYYGRAARVFRRLAELQDTEPGSPTFGLWSYYMEESLSEMRAPDYNFSDFIGKHFIYALSQRRDCIDDETAGIMLTALKNAMECSIKRNVSPDYSNISMMSCMTLISAGELLGDKRIFENGKARLKKAYDYNLYNGAFSEYNSSTYTPLLIAELTRMLLFFRDEECRRMAQELHDMAWQALSLNYNAAAGELSPPQKRAYRDLDDGQLRAFIYMATEGRCGDFENGDRLVLSFLTLPILCPERYIGGFAQAKERFIKKTYYRKNSIRTPDEDTVIVRNLNSPDLKAYTYITDKYSMGAFDKSDLWNQRRTCSVVWKTDGKARGFRLRGMNGDYDFCSAVCAADMYKNVLIGTVGFVNDHGDFHYILDKNRSGVIKTKRMAVVFCVSGNTDDLTIEQKNNEFIISDESIMIHLRILDWVFDGKKGEIRLDKEKKYIELIGYEGEEKAINLSELRESYGAFVMSVNTELPQAALRVENAIATAELTAEKTLRAAMPVYAGAYDDFTGK